MSISTGPLAAEELLPGRGSSQVGALLAGVLTALAGHPVAEAVLLGLAGFATALKFFHWLIV